MALPFPISPTQTDCQSPVDDNLMDSIRQDLDYLDSLLALGTNIFNWNVCGRLSRLKTWKGPIDTAVNYKEFLPTKLRVAMKRSGTNGQAKFDILKHTLTTIPVTAIAHQMSYSTQSIARAATAINTQSITLYTPAMNTQSISFAKAAISVQSIINVGGNLWRYNFSSGVDNDYVVNQSVTFASCTAGGNNGVFTILEINQSGGNNIIISNASGVAQTSAAGTAQLMLMSYVYANPIDPVAFTPYTLALSPYGQATFASHTSGINNGVLDIYKINQSGNNIWVWNASGVVQAGVAGTATTNVKKFNYSTAVDTTVFVPGEFVLGASHSSGLNNSYFPIVAVNDGGNNLVLYTDNTVTQGGVAGNMSCLRWIYASPSVISADISVGDIVRLASHTTSANNGDFEVKQVNRNAANNIVIYNLSGVAQVGVAGTAVSEKKVVSFSSDQSAVFNTDSYTQLWGCADGSYNKNDIKYPYKVQEVNKGGGSNYNIVIKEIDGSPQLSPAGQVFMEAKSIFDDELTLDAVANGTFVDYYGEVTYADGEMWIGQEYTNFVGGNIEDGKILGLYFKDMMDGVPEDFSALLY